MRGYLREEAVLMKYFNSTLQQIAIPMTSAELNSVSCCKIVIMAVTDVTIMPKTMP